VKTRKKKVIYIILI